MVDTGWEEVDPFFDGRATHFMYWGGGVRTSLQSCLKECKARVDRALNYGRVAIVVSPF